MSGGSSPNTEHGLVSYAVGLGRNDQMSWEQRALVVHDRSGLILDRAIDRLRTDGPPPAVFDSIEIVATERGYTVASDGFCSEGVGEDDVLSELLRFTCRSVVDRERHDGAWIHAAGIVVDGVVVLVVGPSGAGKSTITTHLCAAGGHLICDEQVALRPDGGIVTGFTRPILLKSGAARFASVPDGRQHPGPWPVRPEEIGSQWAPGGEPGLVVFPRHTHGSTMVTAVGATEAARRLILGSLDIGHHPARALDGIGWLAMSAPAIDVEYRDSSEVVDAVRTALAERSPRSGVSRRSVGSPRPFDLGIHPVAAMHLLELDDGAIAYRRSDRQLAVLNPAAAHWWSNLPSIDTAVETWAAPFIDAGFVTLVGGERAERRQELSRSIGNRPV